MGDVFAAVRSLTDAPIRVITTHVCWDHIGRHGGFDSICVHALDAEWLQHEIPVLIDQLRVQIAKEPFDLPVNSAFALDSYIPLRIETPCTLEDGDVLVSDTFALRVLHTPGHSSGSTVSGSAHGGCS